MYPLNESVLQAGATQHDDLIAILVVNALPEPDGGFPPN